MNTRLQLANGILREIDVHTGEPNAFEKKMGDLLGKPALGIPIILATALLMLIFDSESAGIVYRYEADFSIVMLISSVAAIMVMLQKADGYEGEGGIAVRRMIMIFILMVKNIMLYKLRDSTS